MEVKVEQEIKYAIDKDDVPTAIAILNKNWLNEYLVRPTFEFFIQL